MSSTLPPLNALRAFQSAARCESFAAAAQDLGVTPSAVGHQVRALEDCLGVRLFDRERRGLRLTTTGKHFAAELQKGFRQIALAVASVRRQAEAPSLTVRATPALALRWLAPKLELFRKANPRIQFLLDASSSEADLAAGQADLDIRYGLSVDPTLHSHVLFQETIFPVCHPDLLGTRRLPLEPAAVLGEELLQVDDWAARGGVWRCWEDWFAVSDLPWTGPTKGQRFTEMDLAVEAAAGGRGLAFAAERHLRDERFKAQLLRPFAKELAVTYAAFLVCLPEVAEIAPVRRFRDWVCTLASTESPQIIHRDAF